MPHDNIHNHVENSFKECHQSYREVKFKLKLENEVIELKNRRKYLDAMTIGPNEKGELDDYR